ncbi:hypothetical protein [Proteiniborus sp.]
MIQERRFRKLGLSDLKLVLQMDKDFRSDKKSSCGVIRYFIKMYK